MTPAIEHLSVEAIEKKIVDLDKGSMYSNILGQDTILVVLSADHGGHTHICSSMKYSLQIFDGALFLYAIYEASDALTNQELCHSYYYDEIRTLISNCYHCFRQKIQN